MVECDAMAVHLLFEDDLVHLGDVDWGIPVRECIWFYARARARGWTWDAREMGVHHH